MLTDERLAEIEDQLTRYDSYPAVSPLFDEVLAEVGRLRTENTALIGQMVATTAALHELGRSYDCHAVGDEIHSWAYVVPKEGDGRWNSTATREEAVAAVRGRLGFTTPETPSTPPPAPA